MSDKLSSNNSLIQRDRSRELSQRIDTGSTSSRSTRNPNNRRKPGSGPRPAATPDRGTPDPPAYDLSMLCQVALGDPPPLDPEDDIDLALDALQIGECTNALMAKIFHGFHTDPRVTKRLNARARQYDKQGYPARAEKLRSAMDFLHARGAQARTPQAAQQPQAVPHHRWPRPQASQGIRAVGPTDVPSPSPPRPSPSQSASRSPPRPQARPSLNEDRARNPAAFMQHDPSVIITGQGEASQEQRRAIARIRQTRGGSAQSPRSPAVRTENKK